MNACAWDKVGRVPFIKEYDMRCIIVRNVNEGLSKALFELVTHRVTRDTRNGPVIAFPYPVFTEYTRPTERVLFSPMRNANPVFHFMEALWMLAGRRDVDFPATFVKRMREYSDDGETLWGAYGYRWRSFFGFDQLSWVVDEMKSNPQTRRCVITMWNAMHDGVIDKDYINSDLVVGGRGGKDVPCNTHIYVDTRSERLNMSVCCRSNDILWGCYGSNAVHFSMLQEYLAAAVGVPVGRLIQFSNDLHLYASTVAEHDIVPMALDAHTHNYYEADGSDKIVTTPLLAEGEKFSDFDNDLKSFFETYDRDGIAGQMARGYRTQFFNFVVAPMLTAWDNRRDPRKALSYAAIIGGSDWRLATKNWITHNFIKEKTT